MTPSKMCNHYTVRSSCFLLDMMVFFLKQWRIFVFLAGHPASGCPTFMEGRFEWPRACSQDVGNGDSGLVDSMWNVKKNEGDQIYTVTFGSSHCSTNLQNISRTLPVQIDTTSYRTEKNHKPPEIQHRCPWNMYFPVFPASNMARHFGYSANKKTVWLIIHRTNQSTHPFWNLTSPPLDSTSMP